MTSLGSVPSALRAMENELNMFWRLSADVYVLIHGRHNLTVRDDIDDLRDEIDVLSEMTDWPALKDITLELLAMLDAWLEEQASIKRMARRAHCD